jgi:hypothetical protein
MKTRLFQVLLSVNYLKINPQGGNKRSKKGKIQIFSHSYLTQYYVLVAGHFCYFVLFGCVFADVTLIFKPAF